MVISYIIVNYRSAREVVRCVESILKNGWPECGCIEVIIVENSPTDEVDRLEDAIKIFVNDPVKIVQSFGNLGYGKGNNLGAANAAGLYFVFVNPDSTINEAFGKKIVRHLEQDSSIGIAGPNQLNGLSFYLRPEFRFPLVSSIFLKLMNFFGFYLRKFCYLSGACIIFTRKCFFELGGFDRAIFMYGEEQEIFRRCQDSRWDCRFFRDTSYYHLMDGCRGLDSQRMSWAFDSLKLYCEKYSLPYNRILKRKLVDLQIKYFLSCVTCNTGLKKRIKAEIDNHILISSSKE